MNLQSNDFELFDLPQVFGLDRQQLDERWKQLQREVHPDRHTTADAQTQRQAMQWSVRINEAYQRLKDPLKRATYLCELNGQAVDAESNTSMPPEFLMQQMEWREALEEADGVEQMESLADEVAARRRSMLNDMGRLADDEHDFASLAQQVRAMMFVQRFAQDVDNRLEQMDA
ncbi:Fe-S protein assembly co-chaperone HscB [Hydrogenophaga sp. 5NK40-0174]|uniref:Fe-S protein assembly co-chaperone HscB n=1 Tax=Hydrogenophaga sp. 5NK40-0174 TaxID=3127649 RepID=UPI003106FBFD